MMTVEEKREILRESRAACEAWGDELRKVFGKQACNIRYLPAGRGEQGSALRAAYDRFRAASDRCDKHAADIWGWSAS